MKKRISRWFCATLAFTMAMGVFGACGQEDGEDQINETKYNNACAQIESGNYETAYATFKELGDYKNSQEYLSRFVYFPTVANFTLYDRSGVMTIEFGAYNMPSRLLTVGVEGTESTAYTKDGIYTYDEKGNLKQQAVTYNETLMAFDYTYDANNNLINAVYSVEGVAATYYGYVYGDNGLLVSESYKEGDVLIYDFAHTYDDKGNQIKSEFKAPDGDYVYTYAYNEDGNMVNERGSAPGHWYNVDYTYNTYGQLTQEVRTEDGEPSYVSNYTYDSAGNRIKDECTFPDGTKDIYTWEFDANGNVTKETLTSADGTVETVTWQYALTYLTIDIPKATMNQVLGLFDIL